MLQEATFFLQVETPGLYELNIKPDRICVTPNKLDERSEITDFTLRKLLSVVEQVSQRGPQDNLCAEAREALRWFAEEVPARTVPRPSIPRTVGEAARSYGVDDARCL